MLFSNQLINNKSGLLDSVFKFYFIFCLYTPFLANLLPVPGFNLIDDALFFIMIPLCIKHLSNKIYKADFLILVFPIYIFFSLIISFFNGESILVLLLSIKNIKNIFLFLVLVCLCDDHTEFIKKHVVFFLYMCIPVSIFQFFTVSDQDDITGLFGPKSTSLYSFTVVVYVSAYAAMYGLDKVKWLWLLFIPVFLNETKITFILFPVSLFVLLIITGKVRVWHFFIFFIFGLLASSILNYLYFNLYGYEFKEIFSYDYLESYLFDYTELHNDVPRFYRISVAYNYILDSGLFSFLFGYGLGAEYVGDQGGRLGSVALDFEYTLLNQGTRIQLFQLLIDFGMLGAALFFIILILFFIKIIKKEKTMNNLLSLGFLIVMLFSLIYQNMFFTKQLSFLFFYFIYMSQMNRFTTM